MDPSVVLKFTSKLISYNNNYDYNMIQQLTEIEINEVDSIFLSPDYIFNFQNDKDFTLQQI